jgi:UDP-glucuronate 4-epimerase
VSEKAKENLLLIHTDDVPVTFAGVDELITDTGFKPCTSIEDMIAKFVNRYKRYYK